MTDSLESLRHLVEPQAGGAPWMALRAGMVLAAVQASKSARNVYKTDYLYAQQGLREYPLLKQEGIVFLVARKICVCGIDYKPIDHLPCQPGTPCSSSVGFVYNIRQDGQDKILSLGRAPECEGVDEIAIEYAYTLDYSVCDIPVEFVEMFGDAIIAGGLSHVLRQTNEKWYSLTESRRYEEQFKDEVSKARSRKVAPFQASSFRFSPSNGLRV